MAGSISVGGKVIATHTGPKGAGTVSLGTNIRLSEGGGIQDSSGNDVLTESSGSVFFGNVIGGVPAGAIMSFAMSSAPTGWIVCNGAPYAIADYGDLYTAIGTTWGALTDENGDPGSTHFRVPDLRGAFLRGTGTGTTPLNNVSVSGESVGIKQEPSSVGSTAVNGYIATNRTDLRNYLANFDSNTNLATTYVADLNSSSSGQYVNYRSTVRPYNASIQYCIKY